MSVTLDEGGPMPDLDNLFADLDAAGLGPAASGELDRGVVDEGTFFQTSQLVDALRDCAQAMLATPPSGDGVVREMVARYDALRADAVGLVAEKYHPQADKWVPHLDESADLHQVVFASVQLARWIDSVHALPMHLLACEMQAAGASEAKSKLAARRSDDSTPETPASPGGTGYL